MAAKSMLQRIRRLCTMLCFCCLLFLCLTVTVNAISDDFFVTESSDYYIHEMGKQVWEWFLMIRNRIAFPMLALSYAVCGIRIIGAGFLEKGERARDSIKQHFWVSTLSFLVLVSLPLVMSVVKDLLKGTAWQPPPID